MGHPVFTLANNSTKRGDRLRVTGRRDGDRFQWANHKGNRRPQPKKNAQTEQPQDNDGKGG